MLILRNKLTLVTGAGSGIGKAIALLFAQHGADVYVSDRDTTALQKVVALIRKRGGKATPLLLDVASEADCVKAARLIHEKHPRGLDVLVNNAGIGCVGTILQTSPAELDRLHGVNVRGVYQMSRVFISPMIKRRNGAILNIASIGGILGVRDRVAYCATKFAVVGITKAMALDHAKDNVRINCICPARVETPFVKARIKEYPDPEKAYREMSDSQPIGRMARPEEIAAAAVYLASDAAAFVTGSAFAIDGGFSAGK